MLAAVINPLVPEITQIITAATAFLVQIITLLVVLRNTSKIAEVHTLANSMKDALVKATSEAAYAAGAKEERAKTDEVAAGIAKEIKAGRL